MRAPLEPRGTQKEMMKDPKWNGVPPVGDRPIENRYRFLMLILLVFIVKIIIWGAYRYATGNMPIFTNPDNGREIGYWVSTIAKPVLQLGPVVLLWWYVFKEKGSPFRFTRKNLASSIFFGLLMALVFFFVATGIYVLHNLIMGYGTDFHFVAGWDEVGWGLIIAMMFSYMIGTGPAEEIFSRGFLQDQTARVFPIWQAMTFSAILFAIGHLPISILMYNMPLDEIMWYMAVLVVMGLFFSIIYQWSRNIVFPILIHGLWDWYLSLFAIKGEFSYEFAQNPGAYFGMVDFINTIITLIILLPIFYLIYRKFWRRDIISSGSPEDTPREKNRLFRWIKERDHGDWPKRPVTFTFVVVGIFCLLMIPVAGLIGTDDPGLQEDRLEDGAGETIIMIEQERILVGGELNNRETNSTYLSSVNSTINWVNISMNWEDEPDAGPRYSNQPDSFRLSLVDAQGQELDSTQGQTGDLTLIWVLPEGSDPLREVAVVVELISTGDQEPIINPLGLREITDNKNTFALDIRYELRTETKGEPEELNVRW